MKIIMREFKDLLRAYIRSSAHTTEILLIPFGLLATLGSNAILRGWIGSIFVLAILVSAAVETWHYEYKRVAALQVQLDELKDQSLAFDKLSEIQQEILTAIRGMNEYQAVPIFSRAGSDEPTWHGLQGVSSKYDYHLFRVEFQDLVDKNILRLSEEAGSDNTPIYRPTKLFFDLVSKT